MTANEPLTSHSVLEENSVKMISIQKHEIHTPVTCVQRHQLQLREECLQFVDVLCFDVTIDITLLDLIGYDTTKCDAYWLFSPLTKSVGPSQYLSPGE